MEMDAPIRRRRSRRRRAVTQAPLSCHLMAQCHLGTLAYVQHTASRPPPKARAHTLTHCTCSIYGTCNLGGWDNTSPSRLRLSICLWPNLQFNQFLDAQMRPALCGGTWYYHILKLCDRSRSDISYITHWITDKSLAGSGSCTWAVAGDDGGESVANRTR
jgi:hypothetical protein